MKENGNGRELGTPGSLKTLLREGRGQPEHRPWPRSVVDSGRWTFAIDQLAGGNWSLLGLWGEDATVHLALLDGASADIGVLSLDCPDGTFPSVANRHAPAIRLERSIHDLFGLRPAGWKDSRPWLDHGRWGIRAPLGSRGQGEGRRRLMTSARGRREFTGIRSDRCTPASSAGAFPLFR
jgi:hypothetical protein